MVAVSGSFFSTSHVIVLFELWNTPKGCDRSPFKTRMRLLLGFATPNYTSFFYHSVIRRFDVARANVVQR